MDSHTPTPAKAPPQKKPNAKPASALQGMQQDVKRALREWERTFWRWVQTLEKFRDIEKNNYELGHRHLQLGNVNDAILRFRFVLRLNPKRADAWYFLGCSFLAKKDTTSARDAFRKALSLKADYAEARYMLTLLMGKKMPIEHLPKKMPVSLAEEYFDGLAVTYNQEQLGKNRYTGHIVLTNAVRAQLTAGRADYVILDLGVGTGLCGALVRDVAAHLTGVDVSDQMITEAEKVQDAKGNKIYDQLVRQDITTFMQNAVEASFDVVMAGLVVSYIGDIEEITKQIARILKPGGVFVFTADQNEKEGVLFDTELVRFRFAKSVLEQLANRHGLVMSICNEVAIFPDFPAWLCVYKK